MKALLISILIATAVAEYKVIDVSVHNGNINWAAVKASGVHAAIIRCGYGSDIASQDDEKWAQNIQGVINAKMPFGVYIYSYAKSVEGAKSEADHLMRLVDPYKSLLALPVFYDLEQGGTENYAVKNGKAFIQRLEQHGYTVGIYANEYWFNSVLKSNFNDHTLWVAKYGSNDGYKHSSPNIQGTVSIWQYTSKGSISGISGDVDVSACYIELKVPSDWGTVTPPTDDIHSKNVYELAREVLQGKYGNGQDRINALGDRYNEVQQAVNLLVYVQNASTDELAQGVIAGKYGNGDVRRWILGDRYDEVQRRVNQLLG